MARVVERVVDDEPPRRRAGAEVLVGQPAGVADVAEDQIHLAGGAAPDDLVGVGAQDVLRSELEAEAPRRPAA